MGRAARIVSSITAVHFRRFGFTSRSNVLAAALAGVVVTGLVSVILGQDRNWDLMNYHYYAAYAYLNDRLGVDLAPVGLQSYFPPLLDVPYYWLSTRLPPVLLSFLMGAWQGLCFILLSGIAWISLADDDRRTARAPFLGLAGMLSAVFLSELGSSMGDNSTAPFVLGAVLLALWPQERPRELTFRFLTCGACMGLAVGLKLTNAFYAIALAVAILAGQGSWMRRMSRLSMVTISAIGVFALLTGQWFHQMWVTFGNPLLPQFNAWFKSPLAGDTMVADTRWLPKGAVEWLTWPLQLTLQPQRGGEVGLLQISWPLLYVLAAFWVIKSLRAREQLVARTSSEVHHRQLLTFVGVAFVLWMAMFSIHRYLAVAEMLAPIAVWIVIQRICAAERAPRFATSAVTACVLVAVMGWSLWGRAGLARTGFRAEAPEATPLPATVLMTGIDPQGWIIPLLPAQYRFVGLHGFPEGPGYATRARAIRNRTPHRVFALLPASEDGRQRRVARLNVIMEKLGLNGTCARLEWWAQKLKLEARPKARLNAATMSKCELSLPASRRMSAEVEDRRLREQAAPRLSRYGLRLLDSSCSRKKAFIGQDPRPYQWCRVVEVGAESR
jgi:hypothetical protein